MTNTINSRFFSNVHVDYIEEVLRRSRREFIVRTYGIHSWDNHVDFLNQLAIKMGRLLKKGEPDMRTAARMVLNDWQRGKLPYYTEPPKATEDPSPTKATKKLMEEGAEQPREYTNPEGEVSTCAHVPPTMFYVLVAERC